MRLLRTLLFSWILSACTGGGQRLETRRLEPVGTRSSQAIDAPTDGESTLPPIPVVPNSAMECEANAKDVCGEFSPDAIAKCIALNGGEEACRSPRWERGFYSYVVSQLAADAKPVHCFADARSLPDEVCGPFGDDLVRQCLAAQGGSACYGNRWNKAFHESLAAPTSDPNESVSPSQTVTSSSTFPTRRKETRTCEEAGGGVGAFNAWRDGGTRRHAGCDLYGRHGDPLYAIQDGTVIQRPYEFYCDTDALEVRHGRKVIRYGEIKPASGVVSGTVKNGQQIARIGLLSCYSQPMLHFEMYAGSATGPLSVGGNAYVRRRDLENPTTQLKSWREALP